VAYDNITSRTDAAALIPEEVSKEMLTNLQERAQGSAALKLFKRVPVGRAQVRFPVLSALPIAYWLTGDTGLKQTTEVNWANKYLNIEEIAVIAPVPDNTVADVDEPIWDDIQPLIEEAIARTLDATVFFGTNAPSSFPTNVVAAAVAAGNTVNRGTNNAATGGLAVRSFRGKVRQARNANGDRYGEINVTKDTVEVDGVQYAFPMRGLWPTGTGSAEAIAVDQAEFVIGVRQDITWKLLDQAVIQDNTGAIVYNLGQQDMTAMRVVFRVGWQVANHINYDQAVEANRYPAAVIRTP
jgi:hypothetical protein